MMVGAVVVVEKTQEHMNFSPLHMKSICKCCARFSPASTTATQKKENHDGGSFFLL